MTKNNLAFLEQKPVIGISACCFGSPVRYNGRKLDLIDEIGREKWDYKWCPVCPEVCAGLGVPRDPIQALDLQSPIRWWDWRRRMLAFLWLQEQELHNLNDLFEVWHTLKFLCQEIDDKQARELGRFMSVLKGFQENETLEKLRIDILNILRKPSSFQRIKGSLFKNYNYYRKITGNTIPEIQDQSTLRNAVKLARELTLMERKSSDSGILFGTSPISNRIFSRRTDKPDTAFKTGNTHE